MLPASRLLQLRMRKGLLYLQHFKAIQYQRRNAATRDGQYDMEAEKICECVGQGG